MLPFYHKRYERTPKTLAWGVTKLIFTKEKKNTWIETYRIWDVFKVQFYIYENGKSPISQYFAFCSQSLNSPHPAGEAMVTGSYEDSYTTIHDNSRNWRSCCRKCRLKQTISLLKDANVDKHRGLGQRVCPSADQPQYLVSTLQCLPTDEYFYILWLSLF